MQENGSCVETELFGVKIPVSGVEDCVDLIAIAALTETVLSPERCKNIPDDQNEDYQGALKLVIEHFLNILLRHIDSVVEEAETFIKQYRTPLPMIDQLIHERHGIVEHFQKSGQDCQFLIDFLEAVAIAREKGYMSSKPFCPISESGDIFS